MATKAAADKLRVLGKDRFMVHGKFRPNGSSGLVAGATKGWGFTPSRLSLGKYRVTLDTPWPQLVSADFTARDQAGRGVRVVPGAYSAANGTIDFWLMAGAPRFIPIDLFSAREISAADLINTAGDAGVLSLNTTPILQRQNVGTDIAARISWAAANVDEIQFPPVPLPPEAVASGNAIVVNMLWSKDANVDTAATASVKAFLGLGDANAGGNLNSALNIAANTLVQKTVTIGTADVLAYPSMLNLSITPGTHASDVVRLHAIWLEIATLYDMATDADNEISFELIFKNNAGNY